MGSRIWPAPGSEEVSGSGLAAAAETEVCEHCALEQCDCVWCEICDEKMGDCVCPTVYVVYATKVRVEIDYEGDIISVRVAEDIGDPMSVENEDGEEIDFQCALARRARERAETGEWPSWDIG